MGTRITFFSYHLMNGFFIVIYGLSLYVKFLTNQQGFIKNYLADLLCMPIVFYLVVEIFRILKRKPCLTPNMVVIGILYFSLIFEWLLPQIAIQYTGDGYDVLMYCIGGAVYFFSTKILKPYDLS